MKTEVSFVEELSLEELMAVKGGLNGSEDNKPIQIYCQGTAAVSCSGAPAIGSKA